MGVLIEVNGSIDVPDGVTRETVTCEFLDWIEEQGWYFGGGFHGDGRITFGGMVYSLEQTLTIAEVENALREWFCSRNWHFEGRFFTMIETDDLLLRRAEFDDWKDMYENVWRHEAATRYMLWDVTTSDEEARARIERTIRYQENGGLSFLIEKDGECIGFCGVMEVEPGIYEDTGLAIGPVFQRQGYGKQALAALEQFVFGRGGEFFYYTCRRENLPSKALALSRGFRYALSEQKDGYILDYYEKRRCDMEVKITYHGHACFTLEYQGVRAVLDPYAWGMVPGAADLHLEAEAVYCSHDHGDHNFVQAVTVNEVTPLPWTVQEFTTPHDDCGGAKRGMNTVRIFNCGGIRVAHLGDIGCFPGEELAQALEGVDCMLIPVGGFYTIGCQTAAQIIRAADPTIAIPMHYRTDKAGFDEISHIDDFCKLWGENDSFIQTLDVGGHVSLNKTVLNRFWRK